MNKLLALGATVLLLCIFMADINHVTKTITYCGEQNRMIETPIFYDSEEAIPITEWQKEDDSCIMNCVKWRATNMRDIICVEFRHTRGSDI